MKYGASYGLGGLQDIGALRDFAQALDAAGIDTVSLATHALSTEPSRFPDRPAGTVSGPFRDPFVLFSYLAGVTQRLSFRSAILIAPLYSTPILAKQAADLSIVSGGRFELGVGISWNELEYKALGQDLHTRGRRLAEQLVLLRRFWTEPYVTFHGRFHDVDGIGLNQLPPPITLWVGSTTAERPFRRAARLADGWLPLVDPVEHIPTLRRYLAESKRDASTFRIAGRLAAGPDGPEAWIKEGQRLKDAGVTDINLGAPPDLSPADALKRVIEAKDALKAALG
jgi:probable F420-dependent oxidoreductase